MMFSVLSQVFGKFSGLHFSGFWVLVPFAVTLGVATPHYWKAVGIRAIICDIESLPTKFVFFILQMMKNVIENPSEPISDASYFECFDGVMDKSKVRTHLLRHSRNICGDNSFKLNFTEARLEDF